MKLTPVESSMISAVGYDSDTRTLQVAFSSGKRYEYHNVPQETYEELMAAESKGSYMRSDIIDLYAYGQVRGQRRRL